MIRLATAMFQLSARIQEKYSEQALNESLKIVGETSKKLEEINRKLKGEKT
jgi:hypothetical protein